MQTYEVTASDRKRSKKFRANSHREAALLAIISRLSGHDKLKRLLFKAKMGSYVLHYSWDVEEEELHFIPEDALDEFDPNRGLSIDFKLLVDLDVGQSMYAENALFAESVVNRIKQHFGVKDHDIWPVYYGNTEMRVNYMTIRVYADHSIAPGRRGNIMIRRFK